MWSYYDFVDQPLKVHSQEDSGVRILLSAITIQGVVKTDFRLRKLLDDDSELALPLKLLLCLITEWRQRIRLYHPSQRRALRIDRFREVLPRSLEAAGFDGRIDTNCDILLCGD